MLELAFYVGKGDWLDKLIRWWTNSPYSHVEIVLHREDTTFLAFGSSARDGGVRVKEIEIKSGHWEFVQIQDTDLSNALVHQGAGYDWKGVILSQMFPLTKEDPTKFFCSELIAYAFNWVRPSSYTPQDVYNRAVAVKIF